ncbi:MAG: class I SAM-dependent methyltransferase [Pseudomonadota bacterium]|nr:class I SAM-dependent methyltransferase [Pseudomonadota bacterium]
MELRPVTPISILAKKMEQLLETHADLIQSRSGLAEDLELCYQIAAGLDPYTEKHTTQESAALKRLSEQTKNYDWSDSDNPEFVRGLEAEMLSGHVEGKFLKILVAGLKAKNILEIGVFSGYSAIAMAEGLDAGGNIVACELDKRAAEFAESQFKKAGVADKITMKLGPALQTLQGLADQRSKFDLVFLDADKHNYENYVRFILDNNLLSTDGLLVVDNTLLQAEVYLDNHECSVPGGAISSFNEYMTNESRVEQVIVPLRDGVTIARLAN